MGRILSVGLEGMWRHMVYVEANIRVDTGAFIITKESMEETIQWKRRSSVYHNDSHGVGQNG